ncbi:hypothetical protein Pcinc_009322 [Petrolisthes cinctipes]|uniref:Uncharacterized protein n=1 Tax=Petrolisthes cinctipes TaxID=88211 RepID=A0AAE1KVM8_PETCI|nr:hypothetical protein Pcinc_009322 [Petrolisthes cinctipes]
MRVGAVVTTAVTACWLVVGCESLVILPLTGLGLASKALIAVKGGLIGAVTVLGILKILLKKNNNEEEEVMYIEPQPVEHKYYFPQQQQHYYNTPPQHYYNTPPQLQQHYNPPLPHDQYSSYSELAFDYAPPPAHHLHHQRKRRSVGNELPGYYNKNNNRKYNRNIKSHHFTSLHFTSLRYNIQMRVVTILLVVLVALDVVSGIVVFPAVLNGLPLPVFIAGLPIIVAGITIAAFGSVGVGTIVAVKKNEPIVYDYGHDEPEYTHEQHQYSYEPSSYAHGPPEHAHGPHGPPEHAHGPPEHAHGPPEHAHGPPEHAHGPPEHAHRRHRRSGNSLLMGNNNNNNMGLMGNLVYSTATHLDTQGCLAKLICHLGQVEEGNLSDQEHLFLQIFRRREKDKRRRVPEENEINTTSERDWEEEDKTRRVPEENDTNTTSESDWEKEEEDKRECSLVRTKCPIDETDLLQMLRLTQRWFNTVL